jgi:O-antigen/teichoic acid export membrane protein
MRLAGIPLSLATSVLLARLLGPEGFGYYSFAMALVPLLAIPVSSGLQQLATRQVVSYRLAEQFSLARGLVSLSGGWVLLYSAVLFTLFFGASQIFPDIFAEKKWAIM